LFFKMHLTLEIENANNQKNESKEQFGPLWSTPQTVS
jgi:hypothetical protein